MNIKIYKYEHKLPVHQSLKLVTKQHFSSNSNSSPSYSQIVK